MRRLPGDKCERLRLSALKFFLRLRTLLTCCARGTAEEDGQQEEKTRCNEDTRIRSLGDNYIVKSLLGEGGFAKTVLVTSTSTGHTSVAKIPTRRDNCARETSKEIEALTTLVHPNIVHLVDVATDGVCDIIVTEHCSGGTLFDALERHLKAPSRTWGHRVVSYFKQIVSAVSFMHENHFVHLDLKNDNLVLDAEEKVVKVIDFGFSARTSQVYEKEMKGVRGTPWYTAPEVVDKAQHPYAGGKADVWALGCVLYELCMGRLPYYEPWMKNLLLKHQMTYFLRCCERGGPALKATMPGVFRKSQEWALLSVLQAMLEPRPESRVTIWQVGQFRFPGRREREEK
ncbi:uncharacterized protein LOC143034898 [Oratosquilla oratoria]|uniref:uncharacterized protein LOC143034898 n=1 Tax=Oratosquilla oratoria TaxID=337810 RepID=UPI003F768E88